MHPTIMDRVFTVDFTNDQNYDIRGDGASVRAATSTIWKYVGASATALRSLDQSYAHWIFYRYADILMMRAEALNELDGNYNIPAWNGSGSHAISRNISEMKKTISQVRIRAGIPDHDMSVYGSKEELRKKNKTGAPD